MKMFLKKYIYFNSLNYIQNKYKSISTERAQNIFDTSFATKFFDNINKKEFDNPIADPIDSYSFQWNDKF